MQYDGENELYKIINRTLAKIEKSIDEPADKEIILFKERYQYYTKQNPYPSLFDDEKRLSPSEIDKVLEFCNALEAYRLATDVHAKDIPELSEDTCRALYAGLTFYKKYISPENKTIITGLEQTIKRILPEFREEYILNEYNEQAKLIYKLKKSHKKAVSDNERMAALFFEDVLNNKELKSIKACPLKIDLYENTLKIVDMLPQKKYNKTAKLQLKSSLYYAINRAVLVMPIVDREKAEQTYNEYLRYKRAAENISRYVSNMPENEFARRKRIDDEWKYK